MPNYLKRLTPRRILKGAATVAGAVFAYSNPFVGAAAGLVGGVSSKYVGGDFGGVLNSVVNGLMAGSAAKTLKTSQTIYKSYINSGMAKFLTDPVGYVSDVAGKHIQQQAFDLPLNYMRSPTL